MTKCTQAIVTLPGGWTAPFKLPARVIGVSSIGHWFPPRSAADTRRINPRINPIRPYSRGPIPMGHWARVLLFHHGVSRTTRVHSRYRAARRLIASTSSTPARSSGPSTHTLSHLRPVITASLSRQPTNPRTVGVSRAILTDKLKLLPRSIIRGLSVSSPLPALSNRKIKPLESTVARGCNYRPLISPTHLPDQLSASARLRSGSRTRSEVLPRDHTGLAVISASSRAVPRGVPTATTLSATFAQVGVTWGERGLDARRVCRGDDRDAGGVRAGTAEVINRTARRSGAVFRRVTP